MLNPSVWGRHAWIFLHSITINYPECPTHEDKQNIKNFFMILPTVLPCLKCRDHLNKNYHKHPLTEKVLCDKDALIKWLIDVHNEINKQSGKKELSYDEVLKQYYDMYNNKSISNKNYIFMFGLALALVIIIVILSIKLM